MPRNYERQTNRPSWSQESMKKAIEAWKQKKMGWELASKTFGIPQATLRRHALNLNKTLDSNSKGLGRFKKTFSTETEKELVEHIKFLETRLFGLTRTSLQELAFELAEKNGFDHPFNKQKKRAGQEWLEGFLRRNKDISLRAPERTSAARAQAFNRPQVANFFRIYEQFLKSHNLGPHQIYNVDETGLTTVQKPQKILATKGRKQVGYLTSAERGSNVTVVCCTNAIGSFIPPCMIFPRKNMKNELIDEAPNGSLGLAQESGWMNKEVFVKWLKHFQAHTNSSKDDPVLLICDGHSSHKSIECLSYAKENGIHMLCLPPHCTHRMQPLDVSIYGPLKTYFHQEISKWLKNHPGRVVTHLQIGGLFNEAYGKAATVQNATNGFRKTGIWPVNPEIFPDYLFEPAETTNIPLNQGDITDGTPELPSLNLPSAECINTSSIQEDPNVESISYPSETIDDKVDSSQNTTNATTHDDNIGDVVPNVINCSLETNIDESTVVVMTREDNDDGIRPGPSNQSLIYPIASISPAPQGQFMRGQGKRKFKPVKRDWLLTSSPNMQEIIAKNRPKEPPAKKKRQIKRKMCYNNDKIIPASKNALASQKGLRVSRLQIPIQIDDSSGSADFICEAENDDSDCACIYCNDLFSRSKPGEGWLRCITCYLWAHASCADVPKKTKRFICELCS